MKQNGFILTKAGFMFPGVNVTELLMRKRFKNETDEPRVSLSTVSSTGNFSLFFNQNMIIPNETDQELFSKIFRVMVQTNETLIEARFLSNSEVKRLATSRRMQSEVDPVGVFIASQSPKSIEFQMIFPQPDQLSRSSIKDRTQLKILFPTIFKSETSLKPLNLDPNMRQGFSGEIPPQISKAAKVVIENVVSQTENIMEATASTNFIVSLLLQGSMQQLFGMIRAMQIIVFTVLIKIPLSGLASEFFSQCLLFA